MTWAARSSSSLSRLTGREARRVQRGRVVGAADDGDPLDAASFISARRITLRMAASRRAFSIDVGVVVGAGVALADRAIASLTAAKCSSDEVRRCSMASSHQRSGSS